MRIGIFTDTYPPYINGVSTSILMLQHALEKQGHQVFIVTVNTEKMSYKYEDDNTTLIRYSSLSTNPLNSVGVSQLPTTITENNQLDD